MVRKEGKLQSYKHDQAENYGGVSMHAYVDRCGGLGQPCIITGEGKARLHFQGLIEPPRLQLTPNDHSSAFLRINILPSTKDIPGLVPCIPRITVRPLAVDPHHWTWV